MASLSTFRKSMRTNHLCNDQDCVRALIEAANLTDDTRIQTVYQAAGIVENIRAEKSPGLMEVFLAEYGLSTTEGVALMC